MDDAYKFCTFLSEAAAALCEQWDDQPYRFWIFLSAGLFVAFVAGHFLVVWFLKEFRDWLRTPQIRKGAKAGPITGHFERALAFALVLASVEGTYVILTGWMAAKLALNWERPLPRGASAEKERRHRVYGFSALMAGTLSLGIAAIGGVIARCGL